MLRVAFIKVKTICKFEVQPPPECIDLHAYLEKFSGGGPQTPL
jgi:hypothetical protein